MLSEASGTEDKRKSAGFFFVADSSNRDKKNVKMIKAEIV
jgi:hypothetical protein